jgi:ABC-type multidrug transport system permease subunit
LIIAIEVENELKNTYHWLNEKRRKIINAIVIVLTVISLILSATLTYFYLAEYEGVLFFAILLTILILSNTVYSFALCKINETIKS